MSTLAIKLFEEREEKENNYLPLLCALFGEDEYSPALNEDTEVAALVEDALYNLDLSNPLGLLQHYYMEERFLHGKSQEQLAAEIAENAMLLVRDLERSSIRFLRHPQQGRALSKHIRKEN